MSVCQWCLSISTPMNVIWCCCEPPLTTVLRVSVTRNTKQESADCQSPVSSQTPPSERRERRVHDDDCLLPIYPTDATVAYRLRESHACVYSHFYQPARTHTTSSPGFSATTESLVESFAVRCTVPIPYPLKLARAPTAPAATCSPWLEAKNDLGECRGLGRRQASASGIEGRPPTLAGFPRSSAELRPAQSPRDVCPCTRRSQGGLNAIGSGARAPCRCGRAT